MMKNNTNTIVNKMIQKQLSISTMESCTSGLIASMITDTEGASAIFPGGYVTYLNETKVKAGVDAAIIKKYGVYSEECAKAMARTAQKNLNTDIAIGVTGTTGNVDPNNADSAQGEVYYCIIVKDKYYNYHLNMNVTGMKRKDIKQRYADDVFEKLNNLLIS